MNELLVFVTIILSVFLIYVFGIYRINWFFDSVKTMNHDGKLKQAKYLIENDANSLLKVWIWDANKLVQLDKDCIGESK